MCKGDPKTTVEPTAVHVNPVLYTEEEETQNPVLHTAEEETQNPVLHTAEEETDMESCRLATAYFL